MRGQHAAIVTLAVASLATIGCGHGGPAIVATFDVQQLPPEPPSPPPEAPPAPVEPAPKATPAPPPPSPAEILRSLNARIGPVLFETGSWEISDEGRKVLAADLEIMTQSAGWVATVEGHADERGSDSWNDVLGIWRAKAVKDQLRSLGIDPSRMTIISFGKTRPVAEGRDPASLARNRRVEIVLHPGKTRSPS